MAEGTTSVDGLIELLEACWVEIDPNQEADWRQALAGKSPNVAEQAILTLKDASNLRPSIRLFEATYRGLLKNQPRTEWFREQREVLRQAQERLGQREESRPRSPLPS